MKPLIEQNIKNITLKRHYHLIPSYFDKVYNKPKNMLQ